MKNVLVTGSEGFVGRNLLLALSQRTDVRLFEYDKRHGPEMLESALNEADVVYHLAGVNRPQREEDFYLVNTVLTENICAALLSANRAPKIILASSVQALLDNPYGRSKLAAEKAVERYAAASGASCTIYRLKNLFGKWCRPNYNSVTATFCNNIAKGLPVCISDRSSMVDLVYIDDVITAFVNELDGHDFSGCSIADPLPSRKISLGDLADIIYSFRFQRTDLVLPDFSDRFVRALYSTYLSYIDPDERAYRLQAKPDARGNLAEFIKGAPFGQIFVSITKPGIVRGNHFHFTKTEKILVVHGMAKVRIRDLHDDIMREYTVRSEDFTVIDIPPGCTHSIENTGTTELVTLFWASEIFDENRPDTYLSKVVEER